MNDETRLPWFPCEPGKLLSALQAMKPHVGYTYWIVCLRIYETGGPISDSLDAMARRTGYNKRVVADALNQLFKIGKLVKTDAGIMNPYAAGVLAEMVGRHQKAALAGGEGGRRAQENKRNRGGGRGHEAGIPVGVEASIPTGIEASTPVSKSENNSIKSNEGVEQPLDSASSTRQADSSYLQLQIHEESKTSATPTSRPKRKREHAPRIRMPIDWHPDDAGMGFAAERGFIGTDVEGMIRRCRDHHIRKGTLIAGPLGLAATWRTWCDNEVRFRARDLAKKQNGRGAIYDLAAGRPLGGYHQ